MVTWSQSTVCLLWKSNCFKSLFTKYVCWSLFCMNHCNNETIWNFIKGLYEYCLEFRQIKYHCFEKWWSIFLKNNFWWWLKILKMHYGISGQNSSCFNSLLRKIFPFRELAKSKLWCLNLKALVSKNKGFFFPFILCLDSALRQNIKGHV